MSSGFSALKWGWIIAGVLVGLLVAVVLNLLIQVLYGVVIGFQLRGTPPQETLIAAYTSLPMQLVALFLAFLGGLVGGRMAGRRSEGAELLAGLIVGIVLAILVPVWRSFSWGTFDVWVVLLGVLALVGGLMGGWLAQRRVAQQLQAS